MYKTVIFAYGLVASICVNAQLNLGSAANFAILGGQSVGSTGETTLDGNLGIWPKTAGSVTGFSPGMVASYDVSKTAQADALTAYNEGKSLPATDKTGSDLGDLSLIPGVYSFASSVGLTGTMVLDAKGNPNAVWIFQTGSTLITAPGSVISLINGAQACNIFWLVGSSATLDTGTVFAGTVLAHTSITLNAKVKQNGGLFALNADVTLISDTVVSSGSNCGKDPPAASSPDFLIVTTTSGSVGFTSTVPTVVGGTPTSMIVVAIPTQDGPGQNELGQPLGTTSITSGSIAFTSTIPTDMNGTPTSIILIGVPTQNIPIQVLKTITVSSGSVALTTTIPILVNGTPTSIILVDVPTQDSSTKSSVVTTSTSSYMSITTSTLYNNSSTAYRNLSITSHSMSSSSIYKPSIGNYTHPTSPAPGSTISTIYNITTYTIQRCASTVSGCAYGSVTTETIGQYTTTCLITPSTAKPTESSSFIPMPSWSTIFLGYTTKFTNITACEQTATNCHIGSVATQTIALYTTICPASGAHPVTNMSTAFISPTSSVSSLPATLTNAAFTGAAFKNGGSAVMALLSLGLVLIL